MISFNKIVHKLGQKKSPILLIDDLLELIDPENTRVKEGMREVYKVAYRLKSEGYMQALRNGLFLIGSVTNKQAEIELIEQHYWSIVRAYIAREVRSEYFIGGTKALEMHIADYSTPGKLVVYTKSLTKQVILSKNHKLIFKTRELSKKSTGNLFSKLLSFVIKKSVGGVEFKILGHEAALLDMLLLQNNSGILDNYLVLKFLKKYQSTLHRSILGKLVEFRYISSINRLREIAKANGYETLYLACVSIIRDEGSGCFLTSKKKD